MIEKFDIDPTKRYAFSRDFMRVDLGLIIQRPAIFMHMNKKDAEFLKDRCHHMNEYYMDLKKYVDQFNEVATLNESVLSDNSYASTSNIDNYPTH